MLALRGMKPCLIAVVMKTGKGRQTDTESYGLPDTA
jgi:hypothetical protein